MKEVFIKSVERQKAMQEKLPDREGRSRRNNIHNISGVPEWKEGNFVSDFVEQLLKRELTVDTNLQNAPTELWLTNQSGTSHPGDKLVGSFLEFTTKETVLKKVWGKKIMIE